MTRRPEDPEPENPNPLSAARGCLMGLVAFLAGFITYVVGSALLQP